MTGPLPEHDHRVVLGIGANLADRFGTLQGAIDTLGDTPNVSVLAVSPVYETTPLGGLDQPDYLNAVLVIATDLPANLLLERTQAIEQAYGRVRAEHWGSRTLDIDILVYDDVVSDDPDLTLPHPGAHQRACDLVPWHDIEPDAEVPGRGTVGELLAAVGTEGVRPRGDLRLQEPG